MKSIKEKQLLVKWSRAMNEPIDPAIVEEVERYELLQKEIIESVRNNTIKDLADASVVAEQLVEKVNIEFPKPPTLDEVLEVLKEETNELVQAQPVEEPTQAEQPVTLADRAAELITKEVKLEQTSFQQPNPQPVDRNFEAVQKKLKFLEQAIGKIAAHGPGSGETRFLRLDDVNYSSWQDRDRHKILKYEPNSNPAYDGVTFGFLTGDQGEIYSLKYDTVGYTGNANVAAGLTAWNSRDDCLDIHQNDGSVLQVGLENYIRVFNNTGNLLPNGTFVQFAGVYEAGNAPTVIPYVNDANAVPLYSVGVLTVDVADNTYGRATVLGLVRDVDTTGNTVGEVWSAGDILWSNPSYPGKLTKVKPTAPNVAISVAAVTHTGADDGVILVRPTIAPRLHYGDFYSTLTQTAAEPNQDTTLAISDSLVSSGFVLSGNTIVALNSGLYKFQSRVQLTSSSSNQKSIILWYKKNGVNIPYSAVRQSISENGGYRTITNFQIISMNANDNVSVHFTVTDTSLTVDSPAVFDGAPNIPSIQLAVTEAAL